MADKPHNKKSPEGPQESKRAKPEYPWVSGHSDVNGRHKLIHADPSKPDESFVEEFNHDGSFKISEKLKGNDKGMTNVLAHHMRTYAQSTHVHNDGNYDIRGYNNAFVSDKDTGLQIGGDHHLGVAGKTVKATQGSNMDLSGGAGSSQNKFQATRGDLSNSIKGDHHTYVEKDRGDTIGGSKYTIVKDGEYATHVQQGNMEYWVDQGKAQIFSKNDLKLTSNSTVLAKVSNSKIEVTDSKITISVGSSKIEISDGSIKITGSSIQFQKS